MTVNPEASLRKDPLCAFKQASLMAAEKAELHVCRSFLQQSLEVCQLVVLASVPSDAEPSLLHTSSLHTASAALLVWGAEGS